MEAKLPKISIREMPSTILMFRIFGSSFGKDENRHVHHHPEILAAKTLLHTLHNINNNV